jgi:hypothetical protein
VCVVLSGLLMVASTWWWALVFVPNVVLLVATLLDLRRPLGQQQRYQ